MVASGGEKNSASSHFSKNKLALKEESRACDTCATACSSGMHYEQVTPMGEKVNECSGDAKKGKNGNRSSDNDANLLSPLVNNASNGRHHASSETSHLLSACSSHGSFSENEESEENLKDFNRSGDNQMVVKSSVAQANENCSSVKAPIFHDNRISSQPEKQRELECLGDNISCISGSDNMKMRAGSRTGDADWKNVSCCSPANSFSEVEKAVHNQPSSCCLSGTPLGNADPKNQKSLRSFTKDSLPEILCCSKVPDSSEISSLRDSCAGTGSLKGERSECSEEQVQSSFARENTSKIGNVMGDEHSSTGSLQVNAENNKLHSAEVARCSNNLELFKISSTVVKESGFSGGTIIGSVPADCADGSGIIEYDVKVCDICGDIGKEESLAICSKCSDGAEHIYCMRAKLDKVPEGDWMCEECALSEENEKKQQEKIEKEVEPLKKLPSSEIKQNPQNSSVPHVKDTLQSDIKGLGFEKIRTHKVSPCRPFSSKSPTGSAEAISAIKRPLGTIVKSSNALSHGSKKLKCLSRVKTSGTNMVTARTPITSGGKSPASPLQSQMLKGSLSKSKSFPSTSLKEVAQPSREGSGRMQNFAGETMKNNIKEGVSRTMFKSLSFNSAMSCGRNNTSHDLKTFPSKFSSGRDLMRLRHAKRHSLAKTKKTLSSAVDDPAALKVYEKITPPEKTTLPEFTSSSCQDPPAEKGYSRSSNSLEFSGYLAQRGFPTEEKKDCIDAVRQHVECFAEAAPATNVNHSNAAHSEERTCLRDATLFASLRDITPQISAIPEPDHLWQGRFEISRSSKHPINCDGIQAHLSCLASQKVLEVVKKLPQKLLVAEVPRLSIWPAQFMRSQASEDNIALYFFPKDLASYDRSYKGLVDSMIKNDSCLKGNFSGFELLIFSSDLLPDKAQRWNKMLFLWGVFRGKKINCSDNLPRQRSCTSSLKEGSPKHDQSTHSMSASDPSGQSSGSFPDNAQQTPNSTTLIDVQSVTSGRMVEVCEIKVSSPELKFSDLQTTTDQQVRPVDPQMKTEVLSGDVPCPEQKFLDLQTTPVQQVSPVDNQIRSEMLSGDLNCSSSSQPGETNSKKRPEIDLNHSLEENEDRLKVEDEQLCKRPKLSTSGTGESNSFWDVKNSSYRFASNADGHGPHISCEPHEFEGANPMPESSPSLDLEGGQNRLSSMVLSRQNEHQWHSGTPNLELSLWPSKQINIPVSEADASLALSLALPFHEAPEVSKSTPETKLLLLLPGWRDGSSF
ncbi:hypothetical protein SLEP1_g9068 [Rubroshorea leprosula]|uniref:Zinc finger PHD-type domain-containing protein n=2 Tax=Rubroshorea leprosula TaxID=152421 RepID=A0AAV5I9E3_9ROSI|nr:hypothetical protein SLEP1_g9068 [Rubroshorea leprosula]